MGRTAAFFDLEGTLTRDATDMVLIKAGYRAGFFTLFPLLRSAWYQLTYMVGLSDAADAKIAGMRFGFRGHKESEFLAFAQEHFDSILKAGIYREALDLVEQLRSDGVDLYIVSTTYYSSVIPYARFFGIEKWYASTAEVNDAGVYTGNPVLPIHAGEQKATTVREIAAREGYVLAECRAYGDSLHDRFMLAAVGHPFAVNPKGKLLALAEREGWGVLSWCNVLGAAD